ncbi:MAG: hypothetical protein NUK62_03975 [Tenericutes bacterium]|nr:hypothetical protein [Mycoplasmatota bacterium]
MKKFNLFVLFRFLIFTILILLILFIMSKLKQDTLDSFNFTQAYFVDFIGFVLIGTLINMSDKNVFKKASWKVKLSPEMLIIVIIYLFIAISLVMNIGFLITLLIKLKIPVSIGLIPFQMLFGYTLVGQFLDPKQ